MFIDSLVNRPNNVLEQQKAWQSSHSPIYMRPPKSKVFLGIYAALYAAGMGCTLYGMYSLAFGKPMKKED